jgi:DNA repair exonuclease SbcCD ATPase subunit
MELSIKNFKSIVDKKFAFARGTTLLEGPSGAGKTSVLEAFIYVLVGQPKKVAPVGTTKKTVVRLVGKFEEDDDGVACEITRSTRPNRLLLRRGDDEHEDDAAQAVIDDLVGSCFFRVSYLPQEQSKSFMRLSPSDKLDFLKTFAIADRHVGDRWKILCRDESRACKSRLAHAQGQLLVREERLRGIDGEAQEPAFPMTCSKKSRSVVEKNMVVRQKNCARQISKLRSLRDDIVDHDRAVEVLEVHRSHATRAIEEVREKLNRLDDEEARDADLLDAFDDIVEQVSWYDAVESLRRDEKELDAITRVRRRELESELERISPWPDETREDALAYIEDVRAALVAAEEIRRIGDVHPLEKLLRDIDDVAREIDDARAILERDSRTFACPACDQTIKIHIHTNVVHAVDDDDGGDSDDSDDGGDVDVQRLREKIRELQERQRRLQNLHRDESAKAKRIDELQEEFEDFDVASTSALRELKSSLRDFEKYVKANDELDMRAEQIREQIRVVDTSGSIKLLKKKIDDAREALADAPTVSEADARRRLRDAERQRQLQATRAQRRSDLEKKLVEIDRDRKNRDAAFCETWKNFSSKMTVDDVDADIEELARRRDDAVELHQKIQDWKRDVKMWEDAREELVAADEARARIDSATREASGFAELATLIQQAETLALMKVVEQINLRARAYLDNFFQDEPIEVMLMTHRTVKSSKKVKATIAIDVSHRGHDISFDALSAGEKARVVIAFNLALADLLGAKILFLDEVTANLDPELTEEIFETIKTISDAKFIVVVAHQVVSGVFDRVFKL